MIDTGGKYEERIDLVHIQPARDHNCGDVSYEESQTWSARYTAGIQALFPVGSRVVVIRAWETYGGPSRDSGWVYRVAPDGGPDLVGRSANEQLVKRGIAVPDPEVDLHPDKYQQPVKEQIEYAKRQVSARDLPRWEVLLRLHTDADHGLIGPVGVCTKARLVARVRERAEEKKRDREFRRWERGPDGKKGTRDDYTDYDGDGKADSSGGGGGGIDIPDGLCPTRRC